MGVFDYGQIWRFRVMFAPKQIVETITKYYSDFEHQKIFLLISFQTVLKHLEILLKSKFSNVQLQNLYSYKDLRKSVRKELYATLTDDINGQPMWMYHLEIIQPYLFCCSYGVIPWKKLTYLGLHHLDLDLKIFIIVYCHKLK